MYKKESEKLKRLIDTASGKIKADIVIKNCNVVDVLGGRIIHGDIALCDDLIAGIGEYEGDIVIEGNNRFAVPGFIDSHVHIESSYLRPEELGKIIIPHGTTTIIADPHEIGNVCGLKGIDYMIEASKETPLDIKVMMPSCVPATKFEDSGAEILANDMEEHLSQKKTLGLGEFMNYPGILEKNEDVLEKIILAKKYNRIIDGHSPGLHGAGLSAYIAAGISTDHECETVEDMNERISNGMYVMIRQGSACHNLTTLAKGVNQSNSRRCLLCTDDCQPRTIFTKGHIDNNIRMCMNNGIDSIIAIQMATINASECYGLNDRGVIAPGKLGDVVLVDNLENFNVEMVFKSGKLIAENGQYLLECKYYNEEETRKSFHVKDFSKKKLELKINSDNYYAIRVLKGGVVTKKEIVNPTYDNDNNFVYDDKIDLAKVAVIERHHNTGNCAVSLLSGYGIKHGAIAVSVAHDSHNIIAAGVNDDDMEMAVNTIINQGGGIVLVKDGQVIENMELPIAGLMSDKSAVYVDKKLQDIHKVAHEQLMINKDIEPIMTLSFMSLPVIPEIKLTDRGLFDVTEFKFINQ